MSGDGLDPWATLDDLLGTEVLPHHPTASGVGRLAFYVGWDPEALAEWYNAAVADKRAAEAGLNAVDPLRS